MSKFGTLKSKIEKKLLESYNDKSFKKEIKFFKDNILTDKEFSKLYYIYGELNSPKGLTEQESKDFITESITIMKSLKMNPDNIKKINKWTSGIKVENEYKFIDDLTSESVDIKNILLAKKNIIKKLTEEQIQNTPKANVPLKSMVSIANQTLSTYLESLSDSDKKEVKTILKMKDSTVKEKFEPLREEVITKLHSHLEKIEDDEEKNKITETIEIIQNKPIDKVEFFKLKSLNESLGLS